MRRRSPLIMGALAAAIVIIALYAIWAHGYAAIQGASKSEHSVLGEAAKGRGVPGPKKVEAATTKRAGVDSSALREGYSEKEYLFLKEHYKHYNPVADGPLTGTHLQADEEYMLGQQTLDPGKVKWLAKAVIEGRVTAVRNAVDEGASPDATIFLSGQGYSGENISLLELAIDAGQRGVVKVLLEHGASPNPLQLGNALNGQEFPVGAPLVAAAENGEDDVIQLLLQYGADIEQTSNVSAPGQESRTALGAAVLSDNVSTAYLLLMHGADLKGALGPGETIPLALTIGNDPDKVAMRELLVAHGAKIPSGSASTPQ